jgi:hypothetical protein
VAFLGLSGLTTTVNLGSVGVDVVGLDHSLRSEDLGTLVISERRLTADVNHGLNTIRVANDTRGGIKGLRSLERFNFLVNVARSNGKNINRVGTSKETGHVKIVDSHISENTAATLDV